MILTGLLSLMLTIGMSIPSEQAVTDIKWTFQKISPVGNEVFQISPELGIPSLLLRDGQLQGSTGCRKFSGQYSPTPSGFHFFRLSVDEDSQYCTDAHLSLEADLLTILENAQKTELTDNQLKIIAEGGRFVVFTKEAMSDGL